MDDAHYSNGDEEFSLKECRCSVLLNELLTIDPVTLDDFSGPVNLKIPLDLYRRMNLEKDMPLTNDKVSVIVWLNKGELLISNRSDMGFMFALGAWWADRPWRKR